MERYDRLPPDLRLWMAQAALPWSPSSCLSIWRRAIAGGGSAAEARARLDEAERRMLASLPIVLDPGARSSRRTAPRANGG